MLLLSVSGHGRYVFESLLKTFLIPIVRSAQITDQDYDNGMADEIDSIPQMGHEV
jgi:hypothetical protein